VERRVDALVAALRHLMMLPVYGLWREAGDFVWLTDAVRSVHRAGWPVEALAAQLKVPPCGGGPGATSGTNAEARSEDLPLEGQDDAAARKAIERHAAETPASGGAGIDKEAQAIALLFRQPEWSIAQIAECVGVDRKNLYRWPHFRRAAEEAGTLKPRGPGDGEVPRGHKTSDGRVEAYDEPISEG
jgi:hypothetical protein